MFCTLLSFCIFLVVQSLYCKALKKTVNEGVQYMKSLQYLKMLVFLVHPAILLVHLSTVPVHLPLNYPASHTTDPHVTNVYTVFSSKFTFLAAILPPILQVI